MKPKGILIGLVLGAAMWGSIYLLIHSLPYAGKEALAALLAVGILWELFRSKRK